MRLPLPLEELAALAHLYLAPLAKAATWRPLLMALPPCLFLVRHQEKIEERFFDQVTKRDRFQLARDGFWYRVGTRGPVFFMLFACSSYFWAPPPYDVTALSLIFTAAAADATKRAMKAALPNSELSRRPPSQDYPRGGFSGFPSGHALIAAYLVALYYPHGSLFTVPLSGLAFVALVPSLLCNCHTAAQIAAGTALGIFFGGLGLKFHAALLHRRQAA